MLSLGVFIAAPVPPAFQKGTAILHREEPGFEFWTNNREDVKRLTPPAH
jgi:hypothetical protein